MLFLLSVLLCLCAATLILFQKRLLLNTCSFVLALLFGALSFALAAAQPQLGVLYVSTSSSPEETVSLFADALCRGDTEAACSLLDGGGDLHLDAVPEDETAAALYTAVCTSYACLLDGAAEQSGMEAVQRVAFTALDVPSMQDALRVRVLETLERFVDERAYAEIYDENNAYRPEIMDEAWRVAVLELVEQIEAYKRTEILFLRLRYDGFGWYILPDPSLLRVMSGYLSD